MAFSNGVSSTARLERADLVANNIEKLDLDQLIKESTPKVGIWIMLNKCPDNPTEDYDPCKALAPNAAPEVVPSQERFFSKVFDSNGQLNLDAVPDAWQKAVRMEPTPR